MLFRSGNLLGYVGEVNSEMLRRYPSYQAGEYVGISGVESAYEPELRGKKGVKISEVDTHGAIKGSYMDGRFDSLPVPGKSIVCTIDARLQLFAEELMKQEMSTERYIDIPEEVQDLYKIYRSTPLVRAYGLEKALDTPAKIYFKNESVSPVGSHKTNTAIPQAYYNYKQGIRHLTTETGAGQWGAAMSMATQHFGIDLKVFMVKVSFNQKPYRKLMMNTWGADVYASPSEITAAGRAALAKNPNDSGSLGMAISEAVEMALQNPQDTRYCLGSVLNHVLLHQTIIGEVDCIQLAFDDRPQLFGLGAKRQDTARFARGIQPAHRLGEIRPGIFLSDQAPDRGENVADFRAHHGPGSGHRAGTTGVE